MKKERQIKNRMKQFSLAIAAISTLAFCIFFVSAQGSTAITNTQFFSPASANPFSGEYSSLMSGPSITGNTSQNGFFDIELFIPPAGCQPYVVRSDLLEEQNVPVFCQVVPLRLNPSVDITRIDSISFTQQTQNPYISGISFYPARAAIASRGTLTSAPTAENIGYVVVVLKRQTNENAMPDNITTTLTATLQYGANFAFGLGTNEMLLPVMTDSDFENNRFSYTFFDGVGFIRAENIDDKGATLSVYSTDGARVFSDRVEKGKTSRDLYLPTPTGGQGMRLTLKDITVPQTKARINVNGRSFDVYKGGSFYDGKCRLSDLQAITGGTGTATVACGSKTFNLQKTFNNIKLMIQGNEQALTIGQKITDDIKSSYYLAFTGQYGSNSYILVANLSKDSTSGLSDDAIKTRILSATKQIDSSLKGIKPQDTDAIKAKLDAIVKSGASVGFSSAVPLILIDSNNKNPPLGIAPLSTNSLQNSNTPLTTDAQTMYNSAINAYEYVKNTFSSQAANSKWTYGEQALWKSYYLAKSLGQQDKMNEMLSRLQNEYPQSQSNEGQTASQLLANGNLLSTEGSSASDESQNIYIELVSVTEPSYQDANVNLNVNNQASKNVGKGDLIYASSDGTKTMTLASFDENNIYVDYSCKDSTGVHTRTAYQGTKYFTIPECSATIQINKISLNKVADVQLIPVTQGKGQSSNFTFSIGIEKRPSFLKPTPEEAKDRMKSLNKQIAQLRNITDKLGKVIEAGNGLCLATSAYLNLKNLFAGASGEASARNSVMSKWNNLCSDVGFQRQSNANNIQQCIANNDKAIQSEITAVGGAQKAYNTAYETASADKANQDSGRVNDTKVKQALLLDLQSKYNVNPDTVTLLKADGTPAGKDDQARTILTKDKITQLTSSEISQLYVELQMANSKDISDKEKEEYEKNAYLLLNKYYQREKSYNDAKTLSDKLGVKMSLPVSAQKQQVYTYEGAVWDDATKNKFSSADGLTIKKDLPVAVIKNNLFVLNNQKDLQPTDVYSIDNSGATPVLRKINDPTQKNNLISTYSFQQAISYRNKCLNCDHMKYFSIDPYKGLPALLPFDDQNGWYVQIKQLYPGLGNQKSYQDSGRVNTFWVCNVGPNNLMDGTGAGDDVCRRFDMYTGDTLDSFPGLTQSEAKIVVSKAIAAIESAEKQLTDNPKATEIIINGMHLKTGTSEGDTGSKCTDFMSASDCQFLFNVCDPFVCPASRCDLGGKYPVDNVIASGLLGSIVLCWPNFIGLSGNENTGVVVPVCLTGINAGLDTIASILESYRDCLNASVTNNQTVGICDEIESAYFCDFFWKQAGPFTDAIFKNIFFLLQGGGADKGGGEYLFVQDAWNNAQKSSQYFTNTYARNAQLSFGFKDLTQMAIAEMCKMPVSATYPNKLQTALTPASPTQFSAWFEENSYTSATVPPTSQYGVFYQIYAGKDQGHYYQVYLKSTPTALGYTGKDYTLVAQGYVAQGQSASEKKDFVDVSGFQQLCVKIDLTEKCGFKSVSTSFALNYAKDTALAGQASANISSETECISGSSSAGALLTPNIQQAADQFINPDLYNQGIIRVCSTENPGAPNDLTRWQNVGNCGNNNVGCWIDTKSVTNAIEGKGIENETLAAINNLSMAYLLSQGYFDSKAGGPKINDLQTVYQNVVTQITAAKGSITAGSYSGPVINDYNGNSYAGRTLSSFDNDVDALAKKLIDPIQKAALYEFKAEKYDEIARAVYIAQGSAKGPVKAAAAQPAAGAGGIVTPSAGAGAEAASAGELAIGTGLAVCSFLAIGNTIASWPMSNNENLAQQAASKAIESYKADLTNALSSAETVEIEEGSEVLRAGSKIGTIKNIAVEGKSASYVLDASGHIIGKVGGVGNTIMKIGSAEAASLKAVSFGSGFSVADVAIGEGVVEGLELSQAARLVSSATSAVVEVGGEAVTIGKLGKLGLVMQDMGVLKFIAPTVKGFSNMAKAVPILAKSLKFIGKVANPLALAGAACDLAITGYYYNQAWDSAIALSDSSQSTDTATSNLISTVIEQAIIAKTAVNSLNDQYNSISNAGIDTSSLKPAVDSMNQNLQAVIASVDNLYRIYQRDYSNDETQTLGGPGFGGSVSRVVNGIFFWGSSAGTTSRFSDRELGEISLAIIDFKNKLAPLKQSINSVQISLDNIYLSQ